MHQTFQTPQYGRRAVEVEIKSEREKSCTLLSDLIAFRKNYDNQFDLNMFFRIKLIKKAKCQYVNEKKTP